MSKKSAIILILVVFLGALVALIWLYFTSGNNGQTKSPTVIKTNTDVYDPFGTIISENIIASSTEIIANPNNNQSEITSLDRLRKISSEPISGFSIIENKITKNTNIHYILRANGNIYEAYSNSPEQKRLSITTIPKVYESVWLPDGQKLIIRYLKDKTENIQTFSVKINPATTTLNEFEGGVDGNHLAEGISALAINPLGDKLFYLTNNLRGSSGFISKPDGLNKKLIFESPLVEWLISWPKEEIITFTTKPTAQIPGYLFFLNSQNGTFSRILGNIYGLTTKTNASATEILYSDSVRGAPRLYLMNVKNKESKILPWNTLPEKCTWGNVSSKTIYCAVPKSFPEGDYPDLWYQGLVSFTDDLWMLDTETMASTLIANLFSETNNDIDISDLQIDKNDNFLYFINKNDLTFWSLDLR